MTSVALLLSIVWQVCKEENGINSNVTEMPKHDSDCCGSFAISLMLIIV